LINKICRQSSKNDSISAEIIVQAFASEEFSRGFQEYLQTLDRGLELDNNKKIDKFIRFIETSIKRNSVKVPFWALCDCSNLFLKDVKKYKRVPWLKIWVEETKRVAYELVYANKSGCQKIVKKEEDLLSLGDLSDGTFSAKFEDNQDC